MPLVFSLQSKTFVSGTYIVLVTILWLAVSLSHSKLIHSESFNLLIYSYAGQITLSKSLACKCFLVILEELKLQKRRMVVVFVIGEPYKMICKFSKIVFFCLPLLTNGSRQCRGKRLSIQLQFIGYLASKLIYNFGLHQCLAAYFFSQ